MSGHGHVDPSNKKIALLISILALLLAISETMSKAYQTEVLTKQIEASNLWSFYQAKTIRSTNTKLMIESTQLGGKANDPKVSAAIEKWDAAAKRAVAGNYLETGRISEKPPQKGLKPETKFRQD